MRAHKVFQELEKKQENMRKQFRSKKSFSYEIYVPLLAVLCMDNMAEDWVRLQLGMLLQIGVLQYTSDWSFALSGTQKKQQENKCSNVLVMLQEWVYSTCQLCMYLKTQHTVCTVLKTIIKL